MIFRSAILILAFSVSVLTISGSPQAHAATNSSAAKGLPEAALAKKLIEEKKVTVVDVREKDELKEGMAKGAINFPTSMVTDENPAFKGFVAQLPRNKEVWVYCAAGVRSQKVADKLNSMGFRARNIGGYKDWKNAGLPVTKP